MPLKINEIKNIPFDIPNLWDSYINLFQKKKIKKPKIVIHGGYGKNNMGDDAILHIIINRVKTAFPECEITAICHGPDNIRKWYPDIKSYHFKSFGLVKSIVKANLYIIGGGGIVNKINTYSGFKYLKIFDMKGKVLFIAAFLAKLFGAQTLFYAIGCTSFPDKWVKFLAKFVLSSASTVSVRDSLSLNNLKEIGVKGELIQILDPALSMKAAPQEEAIKILSAYGIQAKNKRERKLVALNFRYVSDSVINDKTINEGMKLTEWLISNNYDVLLLPISQHPSKHLEDDLDFAKTMLSFIPPSENIFLLDTYCHPEIMMAILGEMDFLILSRLHAVILGSIMEVPIFTITYDNKVTEFVKIIENTENLEYLENFSLEGLEEKLKKFLMLDK